MQQNIGEVYKFLNQDFNATRDWCLRQGYLFQDPYFKLDYSFEWMRPPEITRDPKLFVGGVNQFDVIQGDLGDCWMLASIANLGMQPVLVRKVIPADQSFTSQYAGIFHFRFWRFGKWFDVVIDDRLPTTNGQLVYTRSVSQNEFWTALLEKAYCKVIGGEYKAADAGNLCEALEDFTGGVVEQFLLRSVPRNFPNILLKSVARRSLVGCFIDNLPGTYQAVLPEGLVRGHSYSVTDVKRVNLPGYGNIVLVRLRNPWGQFEWKGAWSDDSPEWRFVPQSTKEQLGLVYQNDGEFWMSYTDFVSQFQWVDMCHLSPEVFSDAYGEMLAVSSWQLTMVRGSWVNGVTAGGARNLHKNPQIRFTLSEVDDDNQDGLCSVLIALLQRGSGILLDYYEIGFKVYHLQDPNYYQSALGRYFFQSNRSVADVPLKSVREVAGRFNLAPGTYCVVPFTYEPYKEGKFMLRIYSEKSTYMEHMDYRIGISPVDITDSDSSPMTIGAKEPDKRDEKLKEYFEKASNGDKEVNWKELKNALDVAVKGSSIPEEAGTFFNNIIAGVASALHTVTFGLLGSHVRDDPFKTIGPEGFSNDVCRSMVALLDVDHSGKLAFNEFQVLWKEIKQWKYVYQLFSEKKDGYLNSSGLTDAIRSSGYHFNRRILTDIVHRYTTKDGKVTFDDFLHCVLVVKTMSNYFKSKDVNNSHKIVLTQEEFMEKVMYF